MSQLKFMPGAGVDKLETVFLHFGQVFLSQVCKPIAVAFGVFDQLGQDRGGH